MVCRRITGVTCEADGDEKEMKRRGRRVRTVSLTGVGGPLGC